ncbi:MAG: integrase core domain-containing protein [Aggregatilineales bacterium]
MTNDAKYANRFEHAVQGAGIEIIHTPYHSPQANAICERFIGSVRRECLDFVLILSEAHGRKIIREYALFFNQARPHQGIDQQIPMPSHTPLAIDHTCQVVGLPVLNGLHHDYRRVA